MTNALNKIRVAVACKIFFAALVLTMQPAFGQNGVRVAATVGTADPSAMLDVISTTKGVLFPRMTAVQRSAIPSPATGLIVYQTDGSPGLYFFNGSAWVQLSAGGLSGSGTATQVAFWSSGSGLTSSANLYWDNSNARLGIGITSPSQRLDVQGGNARINNVFVGDVGHGSSWAGFSHANQNSTTGYSMLAHTSGTYTFINKENTGNGYIGFRIANNDVAVISNSGNMGIGTTSPAEKLHVTGNIIYQGVRNIDGVVSTYEITTKRYFVSARYGTSAGKTVALDMNIITELCGDEDGCRVRAYMRFWSGFESEGASDGNGPMGSYLFTYDNANGRWRFNGASGIDGGSGTQHAISWYSGACYFTDGSYNGFSDQGDGVRGMGLLSWNGAYTNANRRCELIFED